VSAGTSTRPTLHRILCPVDFSAPSLAALRWAALLAARLGDGLDVLHVWNAPAYAGAEKVMVRVGEDLVGVKEFAHRQAAEQLASALADARKLFPRAGSRIAEGDPRVVITELSGEYDLVVMSTHGRTGLARVVLGSVAEHVVRHARSPVVTIRASQE
jgi:nucleotide-binding universal stress UspA family protein